MTRRPGFALVYAVFTIMALSLVALGIMARGRTEVGIASAVAAHARARAAAETAALDQAERWSTHLFSELPLGATVPAPAPPPPSHPGATAPLPGTTTATITRLDSALYLVRVQSLVDGGLPAPTTTVAGLLVRILYPPSLLTAFPAAISASEGAEVHVGEVNGEDLCGDTVPGIHAPMALIEPGALVTGDPPVLKETPVESSVPDPFAPPTAAAVASLTLSAGIHLPRPLAGPTGCIEDDRNWGALAPHHACHGLLPFIHAAGSITVAGGEGRGVLVVDGDARLRNGFRFSGVVVVHGTLFLQEGSRLQGAVRAARVVVLDGSVKRDRCALSQALAAPALDRAFRPQERWWVPVF